MSYRQKQNALCDGGPVAERGVRRAYVAGASVVGLASAIGVLSPAAADAQTVQKPLLSEGSSGQSVTQVQQALGTVADGQFGQRTHDQVVSFQRRSGLLVDGIVGPQTRGALFESSGQTHSSQSNHSSSSHATQTTRHSSSQSSASYSPTSGSGGRYAIPSYIVQCESQGNYHAVNSSGSGAGGAYQIKPATWRAYGGTGLPQNAPKSEQDAVAKRIYQSQGTAPWACAK